MSKNKISYRCSKAYTRVCHYPECPHKEPHAAKVFNCVDDVAACITPAGGIVEVNCVEVLRKRPAFVRGLIRGFVAVWTVWRGANAFLWLAIDTHRQIDKFNKLLEEGERKMICKKCDKEMGSNVGASQAVITAHVVEVQVSCRHCGAIHYAFIASEQFTLEAG